MPFGEYVPLESWLRGIIGFLDLPMSSMQSGDSQQPPLMVSGLRIGVAICYEIVYPELVRQRALSSTVLLTVSNDTWFGHSIGPLQHLQMAQLRALENGRYLLRATSNGVTAIISPQVRISSPSRIGSTSPPASRTRSIPAATSQALSPYS